MPKVSVDNYYTYKEAVEVVRKLGLKSFVEWCEYISPYIEKVTYIDEATGRQKIDKMASTYKPPSEQKDPKLPSDPRAFYSKHGSEWAGWGEFFGTGNIAPSSAEYISYEEGIKIVRALGIRSKNQYRSVHKSLNLKQLPRFPENYYPRQGVRFSWKEFLAPKFMPFNKAREFVRSLNNINTYQDWIKYVKTPSKPLSIPSAPREVYKDEWINWPDFLGSNNKPKKRL